MRLLMISGAGASSLVQGKRGAFYSTLEEFHKYWERIDVICPAVTTINYQLPTTNYFGNVFIHPSPRPLIMQPLWILKKGRELYREHKFDLITVHEFPPFYNGIGARLLWNKIHVPYVLEIHHVPGYPKAAGLKERLYKIAMQRFIKYDVAKARAVRVVNQHQVPDFLTNAGVPAEKIKYIPSAYIDLETFRPMPEVEKKYDLVFAARLEKNKGVGLLLDAVASLKIQVPSLNLLIIGDGPERQNLEERIEALGLENNVILTGWLPTVGDVARAYNSARIFINPSLNEGGPRVALEAMACGLPVITTPVGLMIDVIKNGSPSTTLQDSKVVLGKNGLITNWEPEDMANKILYLLNDRQPQVRFSAASLELVKQFEKQSVIRNYALKLRGPVT